MNERVKSHPFKSHPLMCTHCCCVLKTKKTTSKNRKKSKNKTQRCPPNSNDLRFPKNQALCLFLWAEIGDGFIEIC